MLLKTPGNGKKTDILSMLPEEIEAELLSAGEKRYRAGQVFSGLHKIFDIDGITVVSKPLREALKGKFAVPEISVEKKQVSARDGTVKYLLRLGDGNSVECVLMRYKYGNTLCISTQAGCAMGCAFCASGKNGLARDLNPSEMLLQIAVAERDCGERVDGVVMMGTGEPLANFDASVTFIKLVSNPQSFNIGQRHISLSTSGLVDRIYKLAELGFAITLSVSLHAAFDEKRSRLMPVNKKYPVAALVEAATHYQRTTGRRVSYEYAMISGINDTPEDAKALSDLLAGRGAHVNLIRLNEIAESPFKPSSREAVAEFTRILEKNGVNVTVRRRLGADIDGACGQLRRRFIEENS